MDFFDGMAARYFKQCKINLCFKVIFRLENGNDSWYGDWSV